MTPEQFESTANFILACQARTEAILEKNAVQIEKNTVQIEKNALQIQELAEQIQLLKDACRDLLDASINQVKRLDRLEDRWR